MMLGYQPPRYRSRTHELAPFWAAMALYSHPQYDPEIRAAEFGPIPPMPTGALIRAGFSCRRQVEACPDWLLLTVNGLGRTGLQQIRLLVPYRRDIHRNTECPGRAIEKLRQGELHLERRVLDGIIREVKIQLEIHKHLYDEPQPMNVLNL